MTYITTLRLLLSLFVLALFSLAGCGHQPSVKPVDNVIFKTQIKVVAPPALMVRPCTIQAQPSDAETFASLSAKDREIELFRYIRDLQADMTVCNQRWPILQTWIDSERKRFETPGEAQ